MFEVVDFIYNDEERKVWVDKTDGAGDIYGFDLNLLQEAERDIVLEALDIIQKNAKNIYRHFKKDKIKKDGNVKNPEEKKEEKPKRFEV
jgi:hypothetical protein